MFLDTISCLLDRLSKPRALLLLFILYLSLLTALFSPSLPGNEGPLDLRFSYSASEAYDIIEGYGEIGRSTYAKIAVTLDLLYPVTYSFLLSAALTLLFRGIVHPRCPLVHLRLLPFVAATADLLENFTILTLITQYPRHLDSLTGVASLCTSIKWILAGLCTVALLAAALLRLARRISGSQARI